MFINKVKIQNFRLLKDSTLDLENQKEKDLSLLIGRNNSGKTSFIMLFDRFLKTPTNFNFDDFSLDLRDQIININEDTNEYDLSIKLILEITYSDTDSLENISDLFLDLSPEVNHVKILFECIIDKRKLVNELSKIKDDNKERFIKKNLNNYLKSKIYVFDEEENLKKEKRANLIEKDKKTIDNLINFQVIHAKRSVSSSESNDGSRKVLSNIASAYFNKKTENQLSYDDLDEINSSLLEMDSTLEGAYKDYFGAFLNKSKEFLGMSDLRVVSDLESKEILSHHSKIVYGNNKESLPEHLNGLGYMNILYLLLQIEIKKEFFIEAKKDINLLFIEEPEAHTHPQMQTIFIEKIKGLLNEILSLQTFITTHSSQIVKNSDFKNIRYFYNDSTSRNITIKNFYQELGKRYMSEDPKKNKEEQSNFKFLNQYLSLVAAELFFAEKIIFIEGLTEKLLLPYFMDKHDKSLGKDEVKLSSQNISILEVGANAKAFRHFIDFLGIKSLIITDIDTTKKTTKPGKKAGSVITTYPASVVEDSTHTSNATLRYFLNSPEFKDESDFNEWFKNLEDNTLHDRHSKVKLAYQTKENNYHGRSFEEAFISLNVQNLLDNLEGDDGVKGLTSGAKEELTNNKDFDDLTSKILAKKSEFASSLLWLALTKDVDWNMPAYIKEGLVWMS